MMVARSSFRYSLLSLFSATRSICLSASEKSVMLACIVMAGMTYFRISFSSSFSV